VNGVSLPFIIAHPRGFSIGILKKPPSSAGKNPVKNFLKKAEKTVDKSGITRYNNQRCTGHCPTATDD